STYRRLAILELALMGLAVALAAAMSSSPPPAEVGTPPEGPAGVLTGYPLPPAPGPLTVLGAWRPAPFGMALACVLVLLWWRPTAPARTRAGTLRLLLGAATLVLLTSGPLNVYGKVLISAHALQHVLLAVAAGVLSALAVRAVPATAPRWGRAAATAAPVLLGLGAGIALLRTDALVAASWFGATGRTWWTDALADQHRAGAAVLAVVGIT